MNREDTSSATRVRQALEARSRSAIPDTVDLWPRVRQGAQSQAQIGSGEHHSLSRHQRITVAIALCLACVAGSVAVATAASPAVHHLLLGTSIGIPPGHSGEGSDANGYPFQMQPLPPFKHFYPQSQLPGLLISGIGQLHPRYGGDGVSGGYNCPSPRGACASLDPGISITSFVPHRPGFGIPSLLTPFVDTQADVVWFARHGLPPDRRFFQIMEWNAKTFPVSFFSAAKVLVLYFGHPETRIVLTKHGTTIAIESNLGASETKRVADSLRPIHLNGR